MTLNRILNHPLELNELPYKFNQGGKEYMQGYESCRKECREKYLKNGDLEGVAPQLKADGINPVFIDGYNDMLFKAHRIMEKKHDDVTNNRKYAKSDRA